MHGHTLIRTLTQVSDHSLKPVSAELVVVLLQYTELVCVVISERPTAHIKITVTHHEER